MSATIPPNPSTGAERTVAAERGDAQRTARPGAATAESMDLLTILDNLPEAVALIDLSGRVVFVNGRMELFLGRPRQQVVGAPLRWVFSASADEGWLGECERVLNDGGTFQLRHFDAARGEWVEVHAYPARGGVVLCLRSVGNVRHPAERQAPGFAESVIASVRAGIVVFDRELRCRLWNRFMEDLTGRSHRDVVGCSAAQALPTFRQSELEDHLRLALNGATVRFHDMALRVRGQDAQRWVSGVYTPQVGPLGEIVGVVALIQDVTERKHAEEQVVRTAHHDPLTKLPNRAYFMDRLRRSLDRCKYNRSFHFAVLFLDLDRFKVVNDSLGHLAGDALLVQLARRLEESVRPGDTVARLGGDEFGILLYSLNDEADARDIASRIQQRLAEPFNLEGRQFYSGASIGIALSTTGYERAEDVLRDADLAMYSAKAEGTRRIAVFGQDMHEQALALLQLETDLRQALERQQFTLQYQPIVELATGRLVGFEALLRWRHPERGLIAPGKFIELAEETGLILPIGHWVLREACRQFRGWTVDDEEPPSLTVHINLSGRQFMHAEGIDEITEILRESGVEGRNIKLEITESVILENAVGIAQAFEELRARGIGLSIDDFGTGYSSLSYLHQFPFDTLKIDRSFVSPSGGPGSNLGIARAIIAIAHHLGMSVVAEGIETPEQLRELHALGCEYGQGYFFSDALDGEAAGEFYRAHRSRPIERPWLGAGRH